MSTSLSERPRRRYRSPLREEQAEATRRRVLEAAIGLFGRQGVTATSVGELARAAGVSPETVYGSFGSKQGVLTGIASLVSRERFPLERWQAEHAERAANPVGQLALVVDVMADFYAANPDVVSLLAEAAAAEAFAEWRRTNLGPPEFAFEQLPPGALRPDLSPVEAAQLLDGFLSPELFAKLVMAGGWSLADYQHRLFDVLEHALLIPSRP